jgi:DNA-binding NarL/FixJ family response regulator
VLMDVRMPDLDWIAATREVLAVSPEVKVVIVATFEQDDYIFGALSAGASGFLLKRTEPRGADRAVHTVAAGDSLLSVTRTVIDRMAQCTLRETNGEAVLVETIVRPDGFVAAHVHPHQSERFEVLQGTLGLQAGDREFVAGPGPPRSPRSASSR